MEIKFTELLNHLNDFCICFLSGVTLRGVSIGFAISDGVSPSEFSIEGSGFFQSPGVV